MSITIWDLFKFGYKWKTAIIGIVIAAVLMTYVGVNRKQTYNSTVILQLTDACISEGEAPNGSDFDINEIVSPKVLAEVIDSRDLNMSVDALRSSISITPIIPESEIELQEARADLGDRYEYFPNTYSVTYSGDASESASMVRDILEAVTDSYINFYNEKYLEFASINNIAYAEDLGNYDYIDMADMISDNLDDIIDTLANYYEKDSDFRSMSTGYTFSDLKKEYEYLNEFIVPGIYSDIYYGQITKNEDRLIKMYTQMKEQYLLEKDSYLELSEIARTRMNSFSTANIKLPNAYNAPTDGNDGELKIIDNIHNEKNDYDTQTTYDILINHYVNNLVAANSRQIKADRCDEIISKFTSPLPEGINVSAIEKEVANDINEAVLKMGELNKTINKVIDDYNDYAATSHVKPLTGVNYYATISFSLYGLLAGAVSGIFAVIAALAYEIIKLMKKEESSSDEVGRAAVMTPGSEKAVMQEEPIAEETESAQVNGDTDNGETAEEEF